VEFYHAVLDHYFISADSKEINDLDTGVHKGWTRTGYRFSVIKGGSSYAGTSPVCRFYSPTLDTHFYSAKKSECDEVKDKFGNVWTFEADEVFRAFVVDPATGVCGADTTPTYRLYNNRPDANHRYSDQINVFMFMKGVKNYIPEGDGSPALPVVFCTPSGGDVVPTASEAAPSCTVTANSSTPVTAMNTSPVAKLRSVNIVRSNSGCLDVAMCTTNIQLAAMARPSSSRTSQLDSQSFCSPRSRNSCSPASASASRMKPNMSKRRSCVCVFGMKRAISIQQMMPTGKFTRNTQRQL